MEDNSPYVSDTFPNPELAALSLHGLLSGYHPKSEAGSLYKEVDSR